MVNPKKVVTAPSNKLVTAPSNKVVTAPTNKIQKKSVSQESHDSQVKINSNTGGLDITYTGDLDIGKLYHIANAGGLSLIFFLNFSYSDLSRHI